MTSGLNVKGRFGKQDFVYVAADDVYLCPAGEQLIYHYTNLALINIAACAPWR
jgi:hypothetical protein